jgi:hypothetical protein
MSILSIDLHSSKSTIRLSFHFQNVTYESLDDIHCSKFSTGCNPHVPVTTYLQSEAVTSLPWPAMSPDLNPIEHIWDMLSRCIQSREPHVQNIRQLEAVSGSWLAKEQKSRLRIGGRRLLLLNDEAWRCHSYTQAF